MNYGKKQHNSITETDIFDLSLMDRISDGFIVLDSEWNYQFVNTAACKLLGRDAESLIGKCIWTEFPEVVGQPSYINYHKAFETQEYQYVREYYAPWDKWFENRIYPTPEGVSVFFSDVTTQVKAENLTKFELEKFQLYKQFLDNSTDSFQVANEDGYLVFANEVARQRLGLNSKALSDIHVVDFEDEFESKDDWKRHVEEMKRVKTLIFEGVNTNLETGIKVPVEITVDYKIIDGIGYIIAVARDITKRVVTEQRLVENRVFTEKILDSMNDGFALVDIEGTIISVNSALCEMTEYSEDELIGTGAPHIFWPKDHIETNLEKFIEVQKGANSDLELFFQRKSGETFPVILSPSQILDDSGNTISLMATIKDVSELYKAQNEIAKSQQQMEAVLEFSGLGIWDYDLVTQSTSRTMQHDACFGLKSLHPNWTYETFINFVHEDDREQVNSIYPEYLDKGKAYNVDYRVKWDDGSIHWLNSSGKGIYDDDGNMVRVIGTVHEISDRKETELALQESNSEKETLLAEIHHRVKNNLAVVAGLMYLQTKDTSDPELIERLTLNINRIKSIASIHEELYKSHNYSEISFATNIRKVIENLTSVSFNEDEVNIELDLDEISLNITDALPAALIVNELVTNAFKHAFSGIDDPTLKISLKKKDDFIHLTIVDNGVGLPEDYQPNNSLSIGINLVNSLAEQLDADLSFESLEGLTCSLVFKSLL